MNSCLNSISGRRLLFSTLLFLLTVSAPAFATLGYFSHGYGTQSKAMGGAGVALPTNSIAAANNPASLVFLNSRYDLAVSLFNPNREFSVTGNPSGYPNTFPLTPGTTESGSNTFVIPALGYNRIIAEQNAVGLAIYGNGGMNTDYDAAAFNGSRPTGQNLSQLFFGVSYARKLTERHALGLMPVLAYQMFSAEGLEAFGNFSTDGTKLTNHDTDTGTGFGLRLGYLGKLHELFSVGASYQTQMGMSEFKDYAGLFAEAGDFDIPSTWTAGVAAGPVKHWTVAVDVQQIMYSEVKSVGNPFDPAAFQQGILLGSDNGAGFGWEDMTNVKFGVQWTGMPQWAWRAGWAFGAQPIPDSEVMFNILAPGVVEQHLTLGGSYMIGGQKEISCSIMRAFSNSVQGANPMEAPGQQQIELKMDQWEVEVGFGF
ncbi:outer membrane protein transport protein [candidate division KSB1 bacterium]|nr:outer membrane protein transport protein [candidate division KSB1 bacterium]